MASLAARGAYYGLRAGAGFAGRFIARNPRLTWQARRYARQAFNPWRTLRRRARNHALKEAAKETARGAVRSGSKYIKKGAHWARSNPGRAATVGSGLSGLAGLAGKSKNRHDTDETLNNDKKRQRTDDGPLHMAKGIASNKDTTYNSWKITYRKQKDTKYWKALTPKSTWSELYTFGATSATGRAKWHDDQFTIGNQAWLTALYDKINSSFTSSGVGPAVWTQRKDTDFDGYSAKRLFIDSVNWRIQFKNQGPAPIRMRLMLVCAKSTTESSDSPLQYTLAGVDLIDAADPNPPWVRDAGPPASFTTDPWENPKLGKNFGHQWNIVGDKIINMSEGTEHVQSYKIKFNRALDLDYIKNFDKIKGMTYHLIVSQVGSIGDTTAAKDSVGTITVGPSKFISVGKMTTKARILQKQPTIYKRPETRFSTAPGMNLYEMDAGDENKVDMLLDANYA